MPSWLLSFIGGPIINGLISAYKARLAAGDTQSQIAATLAGQALQAQQTEIAADEKLRQASLGKWYEPEHLMGYAVAFYIGKCLVWDAALGLGSTDPVSGFVGQTASTIVVFYFGKQAAINVARVLASIFNKGN